jgi:hypothetical protein
LEWMIWNSCNSTHYHHELNDSVLTALKTAPWCNANASTFESFRIKKEKILYIGSIPLRRYNIKSKRIFLSFNFNTQRVAIQRILFFCEFSSVFVKITTPNAQTRFFLFYFFVFFWRLTGFKDI